MNEFSFFIICMISITYLKESDNIILHVLPLTLIYVCSGWLTVRFDMKDFELSINNIKLYYSNFITQLYVQNKKKTS